MPQTKAYTTTVSNDNAAATLLGVVIDGDKTIHYLSAIGPKASLQSLWATLVTRKPGLRIRGEYVYDDGKYRGLAFPSEWGLRGARGMKAFWSPLPNTAWSHMVAASRAALANEIVLVTDPEGVRHAGWKRRDILEAKQEEFAGRFTAALNAHTQIPVLPEWGPEVFSILSEWGLAISLSAYGDALLAYQADIDSSHVLSAVRRTLGIGEEVAK